MTDKLIRKRRSIRHFSENPISESVLRDIINDAAWAPSGGNTQPWRVVLLAPKQGLLLRGEYEQRGWNALFLEIWKIVERMRGQNISLQEATKVIESMVEVDGKLCGSPWAVIVHYQPQRLAFSDLVRFLKFWKKKKFSFRLLTDSFKINGEINRIVTHDSVVCFIYALCLTATDKGIASCIQYIYLNHARKLKKRLGIPRSNRIAGLIWLGDPLPNAEDAQLGRTRHEVPIQVIS